MAWMYLNIFAEAEKVAPEALRVDPASLYCAFEQVRDGRQAKGKRYPLALLLTLLFLGKLAGETTVSGIVDWIKERQGWLRAQLNWPKRFPVNSTYSGALAHCDAEQIVEVVAQVILKARAVEQCGTEPSRLQAYKQEPLLPHIAMHGKTLRGTLGQSNAGQPPIHLLGFYDCQSGIVLAHRAGGSKENEISAAAALLHPALVKGRIVSTDALHTQKQWCLQVHLAQGYYLTIVKGNQPTLLEDIQAFFEDPDAPMQEWQYAKRVHKAHGRLERRELWSSTQMNGWLAKDWTGLAQIFRLRRHVKEGEHEREETVYGIPNLPRKKANAAQLLSLQQDHWRIENRLHYRRDVTLAEDACQVRVAGAPQALAALNGGVLALMDWLGVRNMASQMRHFCAHPHEAVQLLCGTLTRENG